MKDWFKIFILFFMFGLLIYFDSLNNKFLFDDYACLNNPALSNAKYIPSQWDPYRDQSLGVLDSQKIHGYYRPTTHIVLDFCYDFFKSNYYQYHLLNLFLFAFASSLIYLLIEKITGNPILALLTGLFYLIHPINGIIVNYISSSILAFQVIFMLSTILLLLESLERKNNRVLYILSLGCYFLSLFWHESGIMIPLYLSTVILFFRKDSPQTKILYLAPYFLIIFSYLIFRAFFIDGSILKLIAPLHLSVWEYLANLFRIFGWYIGQLFYPKGIVLQWTTLVSHQHLFWDLVGAISSLMLLFFLFFRLAKEKVCQLAIVWIFIGFAPACLAVFRSLNGGIYIEPHWFIFSSIGFFILAAYFFVNVLNHTKTGGLALLLLVVFAWGATDHVYNRLWADQKTYALYWSKQAPQLDLIYVYLADAYRQEGDFKKARRYYNRALTGYSSDFDIYNNIGYMDSKEGHWNEAELNYKKALKINPLAASIYNNLGFVHINQGQTLKAKEYFSQALVYDPLMLAPRINLAKILLKNSEYPKAIKLCLKNLDIVSNDPETLMLLINIFVQEKDIIDLKKYATRYINAATDPEGLTKLGIIMARNNVPDIALDCFKKAILIAPGYTDAYWAAGTLLANLGNYGGAIQIWKIGANINTSDRRFRDDIAKALTLKLKS